ncbi:MAG: alpha-E domain-containing protein [Actinobacteria bacterium]|nr:alpha-E domain-containing protein [Actinomycetota bacterium]
MELLARGAESLYWSGRYFERAENLARMIAEQIDLYMDLPVVDQPGWEPLLYLTGHEEDFNRLNRPRSEDEVMHWLLLAEGNPGSIAFSLRSARASLRTSWYLAPPEIWGTCNQLDQCLERARLGLFSRTARLLFLREVLDHLLRLNALVAGSMSHDETYLFWSLGCEIERTDMTLRALHTRIGPAGGGNDDEFAHVVWTSVLRSVSAHQMFRRTRVEDVSAKGVIRFLLQDPYFPRSVFHCLEQQIGHLKRLTNSETALERVIETQLRVVEQLPRERDLDEHLAELLEGVAQVSAGIESTYWNSYRPVYA